MHAALPESWTLYILEGDPAVRDSLAALAASNGWRHAAFSAAEDLLRHRQTAGPACLLMDWDLPDLEPHAFLQQLRDCRPYLPVIVMTARDDPASLSRIESSDPEALLPRPFSFVALAQAVAGAVGRSRLSNAEKAPLRPVAT